MGFGSDSGAIIAENPSYTVRYASTRAEIWRWYWQAWARPVGLWRYHVFISLLSAIGVSILQKQVPFDPPRFALDFLIAMLCCVVLLPLWPQLRFKPSVRTLTIDSRGFHTAIGRISGARRWSDVRSIEESNGSVIITGVNNNVLIVPARAFESEGARAEFYRAASRWLAASGKAGIGGF